MSEFSPTPDGMEPSQGRFAAVGLSWTPKITLLLAGLFAVLVLALGALAGSLLANVARETALQASSFVVTPAAPLQPAAAGATAGAQVPATASAAPSTAAVEAPALGFSPDERVNILLLGSDERASDGQPPRTDTMMLLTLNLQRKTAGMISLPRDLWLPIPGFNLTTKINTAYELGEASGYPGGGAQLAKDTVSSFVGQPVHYYVQADFSGFVRFVDEIGGVTVDVPSAIYDREYPTSDFGYQTFRLAAGRQLLDGETALKYARTRNMDNDYGRAARQQQLLKAVVDKVLSADMIPVLIVKGPRLMNSMWGSVSWDIPWAKARELADFARANSFQLSHLVLDDRYGLESYSENGAWILLPDRELIRPALRAFFNPEPGAALDADARVAPSPLAQPAGSPPEAGPPEMASDEGKSDPKLPPKARVLAAREAHLEILNGTAFPGVAARMRQELQALGWTGISIGDADRTDYSRTLLVNYNLDDKLVTEISRQLNLSATLYSMPGLLVQETTDLRIVIGEDYLASRSNDTR